MAMPGWCGRSRRLVVVTGLVIYLVATISLLTLYPPTAEGWDEATRWLPWARRDAELATATGPYAATADRRSPRPAVVAATAAPALAVPPAATVPERTSHDTQGAPSVPVREAADGDMVNVLPPDLPVSIINGAGLCLEMTRTPNEWACRIIAYAPCSKAASTQIWQLVDGQLRTDNGHCLDMYRDSSNVHACGCHSDVNQQWTALASGQIASAFRPELCLGDTADSFRVPCASGAAVFTFRKGPPPPTDAVQRLRRPMPSMPYVGISENGVAKADGTVSWEDPEALGYVRDMMRFAWAGYRTYAWGQDELRPVSKTARNWLGPSGLAASIVDALDTLWVMGLEDEYKEAAEFVRNDLSFDKDVTVSFFETVIRDLGGLLAAYGLTGDRAFVDKADDLGARLLAAFRSPTGLPYGVVNLRTGTASPQSWSGNSHILAEVGTFQLEFRYLSHVTGKSKYAELADRVSNYVYALPATYPGLYPNNLPVGGGRGGLEEYSFGGLGDSYYEYLLKQWIFTGRTEAKYLDQYNRAITSCQQHMIGRTGGSRPRTWVGKLSNGMREPSMEHLACFSGGLFALGAHFQPNNANAATEFQIGAELTATCRESYVTTPTGLGPERFSVHDNGGVTPAAGGEYYILRPEYIESVFYMWRLTHDRKYREWGWDMVAALQRSTRVAVGYSGIDSVRGTPLRHNDVQESFFLAETLKYLYLLFADDSVLPLDEWVFNTEAHPLPVIGGKVDQRLRANGG